VAGAPRPASGFEPRLCRHAVDGLCAGRAGTGRAANLGWPARRFRARADRPRLDPIGLGQGADPQLSAGGYIAAVDVNGVISTGHAALESPEGVYISLYPKEEIDRSPDDFGALLRATADNDIPGVYQPDYATESNAWCPSNVRVRIRNYDADKLAAFWQEYRKNATYNLTHRNCSSTVSRALDAALDGVVGRLHGGEAGWRVLIRLLLTPELWVAAQIRKRALTMAWTPGLTLDYARAMSMLADPRPFGWWKMSQHALRRIAELRAGWRSQDRESPARRPRT
jgi:hypothetical protein